MVGEPPVDGSTEDGSTDTSTGAPHAAARRRDDRDVARVRRRDRPALVDRARFALDDVLDATGTGARALLVGCLVVGFLGGAFWWLTRQSPAPVDLALPLIEPAAVTTTTAPPGPVVVHVAGAVVRPGVQTLAAGARVIDAVDAAGGLVADADPTRVNLAAEVVDGSQIYVPRQGEESAPLPIAGVGSDAGSGDPSGPINLNTASAVELESLPGVGPATASAIVDHRERNGPFASVEKLLDVRGIGEAKLAQLRELVRV